jgi:hypothetical protein
MGWMGYTINKSLIHPLSMLLMFIDTVSIIKLVHKVLEGKAPAQCSGSAMIIVVQHDSLDRYHH